MLYIAVQNFKAILNKKLIRIDKHVTPLLKAHLLGKVKGYI